MILSVMAGIWSIIGMKVIILYHKWGNKTMNTVFKVLSYMERELIRPIRHAERLNKPRGNLYKED